MTNLKTFAFAGTLAVLLAPMSALAWTDPVESQIAQPTSGPGASALWAYQTAESGDTFFGAAMAAFEALGAPADGSWQLVANTILQRPENAGKFGGSDGLQIRAGVSYYLPVGLPLSPAEVQQNALQAFFAEQDAARVAYQGELTAHLSGQLPGAVAGAVTEQAPALIDSAVAETFAEQAPVLVADAIETAGAAARPAWLQNESVATTAAAIGIDPVQVYDFVRQNIVWIVLALGAIVSLLWMRSGSTKRKQRKLKKQTDQLQDQIDNLPVADEALVGDVAELKQVVYGDPQGDGKDGLVARMGGAEARLTQLEELMDFSIDMCASGLLECAGMTDAGLNGMQLGQSLNFKVQDENGEDQLYTITMYGETGTDNRYMLVNGFDRDFQRIDQRKDGTFAVKQIIQRLAKLHKKQGKMPGVALLESNVVPMIEHDQAA